jgi:outer membrane protein TolC
MVISPFSAPGSRHLIGAAVLSVLCAPLWAQTAAPLDFSRLVGATSISTKLDAPLADNTGTVRANALAELIGQALQKSPQLQQAQSQQDAALARQGLSRAELLPTLNLRVARGPERSESVNIEGGVNEHTFESTSLRISQSLINVPQIQEFRASRQSLEASEWRLSQARSQVALTVTRAVVDMASARIALDYSEQQLKELNRIMAFMEQRTAAGASSQADLERVRSRVLGARQTRLDQQTQFQNAQAELQRLTARVPEQLPLPSVAQFAALPNNMVEVKQQVEQHNPELRALRLELNAQEKMVTAEQSRFLPVLGLSLEQDRTRNARGENPRWTDTRAMLVLNWSLSLGGKEFYGVKQAGAELANRESRLQDELERLTQTTEADMTLLESAQLRTQAAQAEVEAAELVMAAVDAQLLSGRLNSLLDALDASERLYGSRQRLVQSIGQHIKAHTQLLQRMGLIDVQNIKGI